MNQITKKDIERLQKELEQETNIKRIMFLNATINIYKERLGK